MKQRTGSRWKFWIPFSVLFVVGTFVGFLLMDSHEMFYGMGPVQVIAGPTEVWVFAEKTQFIRLPGLLVEGGARPAGYSQEVIVFDETGEKARTVVSEGGPTFHPNIGYIFRQADGFYLATGDSLTNRRSLFHWSRDRFRLMPIDESDAWFKKAGLDEPNPSTPMLDRITEANGWKHIDGKSQLYERLSLPWRDLDLTFNLEEQTSLIRYQILSSVPGKPLEITVLAFAPARRKITRSQANELFQRRLRSGHPRP